MGVGLKASKMAEWIIIQGEYGESVGNKADDRPIMRFSEVTLTAPSPP